MLDKSIDYQTEGGVKVQRGEIVHCVWLLRTLPNDSSNIQLIVDLDMNNNGFNN
jgi:hypothetical protein